jgi:iron(III) transport system substrate-binding protein
VLTIVGGSWCRKLSSELEAGDIQADVIYGAEPIYFRSLANKDALLAYSSPEVVNLAPEYQWDNGFYIPADLRYVGIAYNQTLVDAADVPTTFAGLNDPQWDQLTTVPDATQCASAFAIAAALAQPDGDMSFFENAKANHTLLSDRAGKLPETVASGEAVMGISPHDPVVRMQNKAKKEGVESPVNMVWADEGVYILPRPIAIIADEARSDEMTAMAQAFVDFVLSAEGQTIAVRKGGYVPVRDGMGGPPLVSGDLDLVQVDWDWAAANKPDIQAAFQEIMYGD